jgi:hypothetical protein
VGPPRLTPLHLSSASGLAGARVDPTWQLLWRVLVNVVRNSLACFLLRCDDDGRFVVVGISSVLGSFYHEVIPLAAAGVQVAKRTQNYLQLALGS